MYDDPIAGLVRRARRRREEDQQWNILYEELAHYFYPNRKGFTAQYTRGHDFYEDIWDSTPEQKRERLGERLVAMMCPRDRIWPGIRPADQSLMQYSSVRMWCEAVSHVLYQIIYDPRVRFTEVLGELVDDILTFGMGVPYIDHDKVERHIVMSVKHLKNFTFEYNEIGDVTRVYCFWHMSIDDLVDNFGFDALPAEMKDDYKNPDHKTDKCHEVLHAILPNEDFKRFGLAPGRLPLRSCWILTKGTHKLAEGGYYETPYPVTRWYRRSGEGRGRTPAMSALSDARLIQAVAASLLEITEKQGNPPMQGPVDILRGEIEMFPGGFTAFDASGFQYQGDPLRPVQIGANPAMTSEYLQHLQMRLGKAFFEEVFYGPQDPNISEEDRQAAQRMMAATAAPIFSRVENEILPPILDRIYGIANRGRALPPVPEELEGEQLIYLFDNHISDMREMAEAQRILQGLSATTQFAELPQAGEAMSNLDWDVAMRDLWQRMKVPELYMRDPREVATERQQRQEAQQGAMMAQMLKDGGPGMKQAVEGMSEARDRGLLPSP